MRHQTKTVITRRNSRVIAKQRRIRSLITPQAFAKLYQGKIKLTKESGTFFSGFTSEDKKAHAWGHSFPRAYRNMLRNFHLKYAS